MYLPVTPRRERLGRAGKPEFPAPEGVLERFLMGFEVRRCLTGSPICFRRGWRESRSIRAITACPAKNGCAARGSVLPQKPRPSNGEA